MPPYGTVCFHRLSTEKSTYPHGLERTEKPCSAFWGRGDARVAPRPVAALLAIWHSSCIPPLLTIRSVSLLQRSTVFIGTVYARAQRPVLGTCVVHRKCASRARAVRTCARKPRTHLLGVPARGCPHPVSIPHNVCGYYLASGGSIEPLWFF